MSKTYIASTLIAVLFCSAGWAGETKDETTAKELATEAAESWLGLIDESRYSESWESAATLVRNAVSQDQWSESIQKARNTFGPIIKRTLKSSHFMTSLPGAPDGQYVVIQFETTFENKESAVETVTPMLDSDDEWRVSGYYIR